MPILRDFLASWAPCIVHAPKINTTSASVNLSVMSSFWLIASVYGSYIFSNFFSLEMNKYTFIVYFNFITISICILSISIILSCLQVSTSSLPSFTSCSSLPAPNLPVFQIPNLPVFQFQILSDFKPFQPFNFKSFCLYSLWLVKSFLSARQYLILLARFLQMIPYS